MVGLAGLRGQSAPTFKTGSTESKPMKATHLRLEKTEARDVKHNVQLSAVADGQSGTGHAFRRLFVEVTEKPIGDIESIALPKRIFEQLSDVHVKCSNLRCRNGGVFLTPIIREMLVKEESERLLMEMCPGRVPSRTNKWARVRCQNMFCIKVLLV
jgi:hypothetical protein